MRGDLPIMRRFALLILAGFAALPVSAAWARNAVIFVADGLRYESVTPKTAPTMWALKKRGVDFMNSHALYPTLTTANASAIATGHYLGDTGDYANVLYPGFPVAAKGGAAVVFLENDAVLKELKVHFGAGYLGPQSLVEAARAAGLGTAVVGKTGPAAIQDIDALNGKGLLLDDSTGKPDSPVMLDSDLTAAIKSATGLDAPPATTIPNVAQQTYLVTAATQVLLPRLKASNRPFVLVFWSRDPDATQHGAKDSVGALRPGINGHTDKAAIANADSNLKAILDALAKLGIADDTDVFVTADHGFSTIAKGDPAEPPGFVADDVAQWLGEPLYDPDANNTAVDLANSAHPGYGNGIIGATPDAPDAIVAANGGSDFIYAMDAGHAKTIYDHLLSQPYVGALFVNDDLLKAHAQDFAGALPMSAIGLMGSAAVPRPSIIVGFRSFDVSGCKLGSELCAAEMSDTSLATGQGMHGSFSRADTRNFMAAAGPDFKTGFRDSAPVSNADIAPTIAHILGFTLKGDGTLKGRVADEALKGGRRVSVTRGWQAASPAPNGLQTVLEYQQVGGARYYDAGGIAGRTVGLARH
jgi:arylsulfatase A-like enzyme